MKPIQIMFDEKLLEQMDAHEEVKRRGRSAVLRQAAAEYLRRSRARRIAEQYRKAYASESSPGAEFAGWEEEGVWPEE
jgi:metal-responsive CopG/Arc/MetJ family transcriptional regulator